MLGGVLGLNTSDLDGFVPIVKGMEIRFLTPATTGARATATLSEDEIARIESDASATGRAEFRLIVEVADEAGVVVAKTEGTFEMRKMG